MPITKITYPTKHVGDMWRANEANEIKDVVNGVCDAIDTLYTRAVPQVFLTQEQYDALVSAGTVDANTIYNIYESV